jgi:peptidoglycan/LPS O-acetylase OafA/YrhL
MSDQTAATSGERIHALDLVRAAALLLGIVFHAALSLLPGFELWLVMDQERSWPVAWLAFVLHTFRMTTFFLLAGYFGRLVLVRRGAKGFVSNRAKRILAPLVIFWLPVMILFGLAMALAAALGAIPTTDEPPPPPQLTVAGFPLTHLWFLYVLLILYAVTLLLRGAVAAVDRGGALRGAVDKALTALMRLPFALPLLLAVPVAALLLNHEGWAEWWGIPTPDIGLVPNTAALGSYGVAFAAGWLVHRLKDGFVPLAGQWRFHLPAALAVTIACLAMTGGPAFGPQFEGQTKVLFAALYAASIWLWTFGLIGAALRFLRKESPKVRYLADSSYWLYIVHLPLIVALQAVVARWRLPAELKLVLIVAGGVAVMLVTYHWLVRSTWVGLLLNGRRYLRKAAHRRETQYEGISDSGLQSD